MFVCKRKSTGNYRLDYIYPLKKSLIIIYNIFLGRGVTSRLTLAFRIGVSRCDLRLPLPLWSLLMLRCKETKINSARLVWAWCWGAIDKLADRWRHIGGPEKPESFITGVMYNPCFHGRRAEWFSRLGEISKNSPWNLKITLLKMQNIPSKIVWDSWL